jgi:hypothetical protein
MSWDTMGIYGKQWEIMGFIELTKSLPGPKQAKYNPSNLPKRLARQSLRSSPPTACQIVKPWEVLKCSGKTVKFRRIYGDFGAAGMRT